MMTPTMQKHLEKAAARRSEYSSFLTALLPAPVSRSIREARSCIHLGQPTGNEVEITLKEG
jgi:hypothetical protein